MRPSRSIPRLEELESRLTPATLVDSSTVTYQDADGDLVTLKLTGGLLDAGNIETVLQFDTDFSDQGPQQLQLIDLTSLESTGESLKVTAVVNGGDGQVHIGRIDASGINLAKVLVQGDLGKIDVGYYLAPSKALGTLDIRSLGKQGLATQGGTGDLVSTIDGKLGTLLVRGDIDQAAVNVGGKVTEIRIQGDLIGGDEDASGNLYIAGSVELFRIDGSVIGGLGTSSGSILILGNVTEKLTITGDLRGGDGEYSGQVQVSSLYDYDSYETTGGNLAKFIVGGSVVGGVGTGSGSVATEKDLGTVLIGGDLTGGDGEYSGRVFSYNRIKKVTVLGSVTGGVGTGSGSINSTHNLGPVKIVGDLRGGGGSYSGSVRSTGKEIYIYHGYYDYEIKFVGKLSTVTIGGSVLGGEGDHSASILSPLSMGDVIIGGDLRGGEGPYSGSLHSSQRTEYVYHGYYDYDIVHKGGVIASVTVAGSVLGGAGPGSASIVAEKKLGPVKVRGSLTAASLSAGVLAGGDGFFGTDDDEVILAGSITSITIGGAVEGTAAADDFFAFIAAKLNSITIDGKNVPLSAGAGNDDDPLGTQDDFRAREVDVEVI